MPPSFSLLQKLADWRVCMIMKVGTINMELRIFYQ